VQQFLSGRGDDVSRQNKLTAFLSRRMDIVNEYQGLKFRITVDGKKVFHAGVGGSGRYRDRRCDFLLWIPSPLSTASPKAPFIVFTANVFALMGLRQLYFLLGHLIDKLAYLHLGIAFILTFIGLKLVSHALHDNELSFLNGGENMEWAPDIGTWESLAVILGAMTIAVVASVLKLRRDTRSGTPPEF